MKTKKLTVKDLKRMINEVKHEMYDDRQTKIKRLEAELNSLYNDPVTNADLIHDLEFELDELYEEEVEAKDELERSRFNSSYGDDW